MSESTNSIMSKLESCPKYKPALSESTNALILFVVSMAIGLGVYIGTCRYYDAREQGAKMFCVEQKAKHKFCEKYF